MPVLTEHAVQIGDRLVTLFEGSAGWGEWSPLPGYPCDPEVCRRAAQLAATVAFPPPIRDVVAVNALVDGVTFDSEELRAYPAVKIKVTDRGDVDLVARIRDALGPSVALRVDANGAWDTDHAVEMIHRLARYDIELVEQPVRTLDELARVRRSVDVAVAADECVRSVDDARRLRELDAADVIVVKQQPLGGVHAALAVVEEAGVPAIVSSMMETSVGIAAGLALAACLPELPYACGLATAGKLPADVTSDPLVPVDGALRVRRIVPDLVIGRYSPSDQERNR